MAAPKNARKLRRYSTEFKLKAVGLSKLPGILTKDVADALEIHPFMLSRWKKDVREGTIVGKRGVKVDVDSKVAGELRRLREVERKYAILREEHALLKKAIRFCSELRRKCLPTSTQTGANTRSR